LKEYREIMDGCTCHLGLPPCGFCQSLSYEEWEAYDAGGIRGLCDFLDKQEEDRLLALFKPLSSDDSGVDLSIFDDKENQVSE
jgi:hypothetical protein